MVRFPTENDDEKFLCGLYMRLEDKKILLYFCARACVDKINFKYILRRKHDTVEVKFEFETWNRTHTKRFTSVKSFLK